MDVENIITSNNFMLHVHLLQITNTTLRTSDVLQRDKEGGSIETKNEGNIKRDYKEQGGYHQKKFMR